MHGPSWNVPRWAVLFSSRVSPWRLTGWLLALPAALWLALFFAVPILILGAYSVMPRGVYGGVESGFTLEHYRRFWEDRLAALENYVLEKKRKRLVT